MTDFILLKLPEVFIYKTLPREPAGYRAENWNVSLWRGRLEVIGSNNQCIIRLLDADNELFALCYVNKNIKASVEKVIDSSRYFVLRIEDGDSRHAYIGLGFNERNDAFDFICCLQDYFNRESPTIDIIPQETGRFSIKKDGKISININQISKKHHKRIHDLNNNSFPVPPESSIIPRKISPSKSSNEKKNSKNSLSNNNSISNITRVDSFFNGHVIL